MVIHMKDYIELSPAELTAKIADTTAPPLHTVLDDRRLRPFMTEEEFNAKWGLPQSEKK
jgi:hypothetical protein